MTWPESAIWVRSARSDRVSGNFSVGRSCGGREAAVDLVVEGAVDSAPGDAEGMALRGRVGRRQVAPGENLAPAHGGVVVAATSRLSRIAASTSPARRRRSNQHGCG